MKEFQGQFFDGKSSRAILATIKVEAFDHLVIRFEDQEIRVKINSCQIEAPVSQGILIIEHPEGWKIEVSPEAYDKEVLNHLLPTESKLLYFLESNKKVIFLTLVITIISGYLFINHGAPYLSRILAQNLPEKVALSIERPIKERVEKEYLKPSSLAENKIADLKNYIHSHSNFNSSISIRSGGEKVKANAFALSAQTVFITDELIELFKDKNLILAIYFHEEGHLVKRHVLSGLISLASLNVISYLFIGDMAGLTETMVGLGVTLVSLKHTRDFENAADRYAIDQLIKAGKSPLCFVQALEKLDEYYSHLSKNSNALTEYFSTHPQTSSRIKNIRARFKNQPKCETLTF